MEVSMILTKGKFFLEELNFDIPELAAAAKLYQSGDEAGAEHAFAEYWRKSADTERYFEYTGRGVTLGGSTSDASLTLAENADNILRGKVRSCSYTYDFNGDIDWSFNGTPDGYREWTWQLNRHHVFKQVAGAYLETGDEKYAKGFEKLIVSWIDTAECPGWPVTNRCSKYPMWRTISAGIRQSGNWPFAIHSFIKSPSISDSTWVKVAMSLWEHGEFLMNSPSSLNWLDIEMSGLCALGCYYPFFKKSDEWSGFAVDMLAKELTTQVYDDGFQCELTTGYQSVVISTNLSVYNLAKRYGKAVTKVFEDRIRLLYTMYPKLMRPDGLTPCTNDGSCASVKSMTENGLKHFPGDPEFTAILEGRIGEYYPLDVVMPWSGMVTMRTGWGEKDVWCFFESAPFGAGHQHEDKLNFNLFAYGKNMIDVIGNFSYDNSPMRKLCVRTRGHNTGLVDGRGQNTRATHTKWSDEKVSIKSDLETKFTDLASVAYGKYNLGYGGDLIPVLHERKVVFFKKGINGSLPFFVLLDDFTAEDELEHKYELNYILFNKPLTLRGRSASMDYGDGVTLEMATNGALSATIGASAPEYMGYRKSADRLATEHIPTPFVNIYGYGKEAHLITVLYPTPDGKAPEIYACCDKDSFTVKLGEGEYTFSRDDDFLKTEPV